MKSNKKSLVDILLNATTPNDKVIEFIPFLMLIITTLFTVFQFTELNANVYNLLSQTTGCSIATNIIFLTYAKHRNLAVYSRIAATGLLCMNVVTLIGQLFELQNIYFYVTIDTIAVVSFFLISLYCFIDRYL